jgi:hypothetical protein
MSNRLRLAILAATISGLLAAPALEAKPKHSGGDQLAELLQGRQAGEPRRCISTFANNNLRIIDKTAIVYRDGKTIWVNRTRDPASLDDDDVLVIRRFGSDLCRLDDIRAVTRGTGMLRAVILLEDFVPYTKLTKTGG